MLDYCLLFSSIRSYVFILEAVALHLWLLRAVLAANGEQCDRCHLVPHQGRHNRDCEITYQFVRFWTKRA